MGKVVQEYDTSVGLPYLKIKGICQVHNAAIDVTKKAGGMLICVWI